ncbi:mitochondrial import inner membrane translocase, subunit Tim17/22 [Lindgomyces ingoldianus]|uniref:Mitochondrial import inner membrane translocase, subunit Tim17/22 n=1 Tax=Lindgomyces ingoldianus TaxID=673940 RepID=A0ACB6QGB0_9PLEO|nr:mitochondrial import inner membrane translocase, subunit Tim17/22 [Lindgomyces ingoldianus]KAF2465171.1 mitochondrial import inner membrane translocase, subunit Tim17/22 [Lindgomyces ingoldianus]
MSGGGFGNQNAGMTEQEQQMVKYMQMGMESCAGKTIMAGVMGGGLGAMFGLFMASMRYDTPMSQPLPVHNPNGTTVAAAPKPISDLPLRQQLKVGLRDMYRSSLSSGRNFAVVGAVFSGTECAIEGLRAKNDLWNGVAGGCITGGVLARKAGPQAVAVGCAGFAAFSAAIDAYMRMPEDERSRPIA